MIPYGKHSISEEDIQAVCDVLRSDWITQGAVIERFEKSVATYCGAKYAVAVCNGTSALHAAYLALGLKEGDTVWTSPNTFVATANAALFCGAKVDFIDIDPETYCLSISKLEQKLKVSAEVGQLPKAVVPVHLAGQSCEMSRIHELSQQYGFTIVEDACHAIGGDYKGEKIGNCEFSNMAVFSFHPVKIVTTGEGGMVVTNSTELYERLKLFRSHGITREVSMMSNPYPEPWYYEQVELGMNYRLTDIQAALGLSQLKMIDQFVKKRRQIAERYNSELKNLPLVLPYQQPDSYSSYHLYVIKLKLNDINKSHLQVFQELKEKGIGVNLHYIPVHTQPIYRKLGFQIGAFPIAEQYYKEAISIPMFYGLKEDEQIYVIAILREILKS